MTQLERLNGLTELELGDCDMLTETVFLGVKNLKELRRDRIEQDEERDRSSAGPATSKTSLVSRGLTVFQCPRITDTGLGRPDEPDQPGSP